MSSIGRLTRVRLPRPGRRSRRSPSPSPSQAEVVIHPHRSIVYAKRVSVPLKFGVRRVVDEARVARITRSQPLSLMDVVPLAWVTFEIRHRSPDRRPGPCHCQAARRQDRRRVFDRSSHPCPPPRPGRRSRRSPSPSPSQAEVVIHPHRSIVYAKRVSVPLKFGVRRVVDEARVARITRSQPLSLMDVVPLAWVTFEIRHRSPDRRPGPCHCQAARRQDRRRVFDRSSHPCPPTASGASFTPLTVTVTVAGRGSHPSSSFDRVR